MTSFVPRLVASLLCAALVFSGVGWFGIERAIDRDLRAESEMIGTDWARYIERRILALTAPGAGADRTPPDRAAFEPLIEAIMAVDNIYQIDIHHTGCNCAMRFQTGAAIPESVGPQQHRRDLQGAGADTDVLPRPLPMNRAQIRQLRDGGPDRIFIHDGTRPDQPGTFAEVYHPVTIDGTVRYVVRALVNLDKRSARIGQLLYQRSALALLLLVAAFGYPMAMYMRSVRRRKASDRRSLFLAHHDMLTGLTNRHGFKEGARALLNDCRDRQVGATIVMFDLDSFQEVNDFFSHQTGDDLLCAFADALRAVVPDGSLVCRVGSDEFAVVMTEDVTGDGTSLSFPTTIETPGFDGTRMVHSTISAGRAIFPRDGRDIGALMQNADLALHAAKKTRDGRICDYLPYMQEKFSRKLTLRETFRKAIGKGEIEAFYQPLVDLQTGAVGGFEALARWIHPDKGILTPGVFWEVLDDPAISAPLGEVMLTRILSDMRDWTGQGIPFERVGINTAEGDLMAPKFAQDVLSHLARHDLEPDRLVIEVTENCLFGPSRAQFTRHLTDLRDAGCRISLDDFGTGFSSIVQLRSCP